MPKCMDFVTTAKSVSLSLSIRATHNIFKHFNCGSQTTISESLNYFVFLKYSMKYPGPNQTELLLAPNL